MHNYISIKDPFQNTLEIKKSTFITYLYPIFNAEAFDDIYSQLKKEHYKANHLCYAYILGNDSMVQRMSDDGEPSGTAGIPMLEVLKRRQLTNIAAITVRYFGGIKLGASGLIRAYSSSVSEALKLVDLIQNIDQQIVEIVLHYAQNDAFIYFINNSQESVTILDTQYTDKVTYTLALNLEAVESFQQSLIERLNNQFEWTNKEIQTVDIPYQDPMD
ncbi:YigZ family protein [Fundicoccus culcitae]|uniref:YigZ family protein n=1 Tax=Fundicoccus culcitae TaxID=2969821 RepID=A0ABY5P3B6_9LACT|nr:YigZ family protein [Fundicoccus culcitae]UUX32943.1 YigZ family protein [Fundicoccus culcitae]